MLARSHRITRASDYRSIVRHGTKVYARSVIVYVHACSEHCEPRFGFIVSKAVGNAVMRNRIRRRLKAIAHEIVHLNESDGVRLSASVSVVIRALPESAQTPWANLRSDIMRGVSSVIHDSTFSPLARVLPRESA